MWTFYYLPIIVYHWIIDVNVDKLVEQFDFFITAAQVLLRFWPGVKEVRQSDSEGRFQPWRAGAVLRPRQHSPEPWQLHALQGLQIVRLLPGIYRRVISRYHREKATLRGLSIKLRISSLQEQVSDLFSKPMEWNKKALLNISASGMYNETMKSREAIKHVQVANKFTRLYSASIMNCSNTVGTPRPLNACAFVDCVTSPPPLVWFLVVRTNRPMAPFSSRLQANFLRIGRSVNMPKIFGNASRLWTCLDRKNLRLPAWPTCNPPRKMAITCRIANANTVSVEDWRQRDAHIPSDGPLIRRISIQINFPRSNFELTHIS